MIQAYEYNVWGDHSEPFSIKASPENRINEPFYFVIDQCGDELHATLTDLRLLVEAAEKLIDARILAEQRAHFIYGTQKKTTAQNTEMEAD